MTTKRGRPNQQYGKLKLLLVAGSVIATIAGTQLLPVQDGLTAETPTADPAYDCRPRRLGEFFPTATGRTPDAG